MGSRRKGKREKERKERERKGKKWKDWWLTASASPMVQINRLNERVKCCGEVDGVAVVRKWVVHAKEAFKVETGKMVENANDITYGARR